MPCDLPGVLSFLGLPPETEMPPGNKGKTKLKKLYRKVAPNKAYHSGERAKDLISHLDMAIRASAHVQELGCSSIRARGSFRLDWGRMAGRKRVAFGVKPYESAIYVLIPYANQDENRLRLL